MSQCRRNLEFLIYLEGMVKDGLVDGFYLICNCDCEARFTQQEVYRKYHTFTTIPEVRRWILSHCGHQAWMSFQVNGLKCKPGYRHESAFADVLVERELTPRQRRIIKKLRALSESTPYREEADAALGRIEALERRSAEHAQQTPHPEAELVCKKADELLEELQSPEEYGES